MYEKLVRSGIAIVLGVTVLVVGAMMVNGCGSNWVVPQEQVFDANIPCDCGDHGDVPEVNADAGTPTPPVCTSVCQPKPPKTCKTGYTLGKDDKCHRNTCPKFNPPDDDKCECNKPSHGKGTGHCKDQPKTYSHDHGNGHCKYDCE